MISSNCVHFKGAPCAKPMAMFDLQHGLNGGSTGHLEIPWLWSSLTWVISHVPMFHITQPWSVLMVCKCLLDGYFFRWCPIFPSHGTFTNPCLNWTNTWISVDDADKAVIFFAWSLWPLNGWQTSMSLSQGKFTPWENVGLIDQKLKVTFNQ